MLYKGTAVPGHPQQPRNECRWRTTMIGQTQDPDLSGIAALRCHLRDCNRKHLHNRQLDFEIHALAPGSALCCQLITTGVLAL